MRGCVVGCGEGWGGVVVVVLGADILKMVTECWTGGIEN
jgi:hypothetical protein